MPEPESDQESIRESYSTMSDQSDRYPHPHITLDWLRNRAKGYLAEHMGFEPVEVGYKRMVARLKVEKHHTAPNGYLHAASIIALADTCCGYATLAHLPDDGKSFTTIELKSNHLGTATEGYIQAVATAQHLGGATQVWDAEVTRESDGKKIALFRCTQMILK
jgi:1,4-dihydroxy-2-naphthoyl-CoA hydrolase